jgi:hypothetical protein
MDQEKLAEFRVRAIALLQKARDRAAKLPATVWVVIALLMVAVFLMAIHTAMSSRDASLRLKVQHSFRSAQLEVWVDSEPTYSGRLNGSAKKKYGIIDTVQGSLSETLDVPSGSHKVKVRVTADDGTVQEDTASAEFVRGGQRTLAVNAKRSDVSLNWQGGSSAPVVSDPPPASSGWIARYASTLLLTIAGSIISALTGYAVRELPGHIRARQTTAEPSTKA